MENLWEQALTWSMLSPNCLTHEPDMACVGDCFLLFIILLNPVDKDLACISRQEHPLSVPHFLLTVCESKRHKLQITSQQINIYVKVSKTWFALRVDFQCCVIFMCILVEPCSSSWLSWRHFLSCFYFIYVIKIYVR